MFLGTRFHRGCRFCLARWTDAYRRQLRTSRVKRLASGVDAASASPKPLPERLFLVDGQPQVHRLHIGYGENRVYYGIEPAGRLTGSFVHLLLHLLERRPALTHLAVVFDVESLGPPTSPQESSCQATFRHDLYPEYKSNRPPPPPEVNQAIATVKELLSIMEVKVLCVPGVEGDDVIGTMTRRALEAGLEVTIVSPDRDFYQLLGPKVKLMRMIKRQAPEYYTSMDFAEEYQLDPKQWLDVMSLAGDSADHVPGVRGVGLKTALALIQEYGTLDNLLNSAAEVRQPALRRVLQSDEGQVAARFSRELLAVHTHLRAPDCEIPLEDLRFHVPKDAGWGANEVLRRNGLHVLAGHLMNIYEGWPHVQAVT